MSVIISAQDVHKAFGKKPVLKGLSLDVEEGQVVCILGSSGSGKSTFLRTINHLEPIDAGRIFFRHELIGYEARAGKLYEMSERETARQRQRMGMVFQHFNLFGHRTALENVMEGPRRVLKESRLEVEARARGLLERVGLADRMDAFPRQLSGGQQQRVAIARALAMHPEVILFDEPTSALDPELVAEVLTVIRSLASDGMTMIIVTHEIAFARDVADVVVVMADGVIVEQGSPREVLGKPQHERTRAFLARSLN
jgi:polar amino acid transport system ATP-binding protein